MIFKNKINSSYINELIVQGEFNNVSFASDKIVLDNINIQIVDGSLIVSKLDTKDVFTNKSPINLESTICSYPSVDDSSVNDSNECKRNQLAITKMKQSSIEYIVDLLKNNKKISSARQVSIREYNANILVNENYTLKTLRSKNYSPKGDSVVSGYFTLDWDRYANIDFYTFCIDTGFKPIIITFDLKNILSILSNKRGKQNKYRFNIKYNIETKELYDIADFKDEHRVDYRDFKDFDIISF